MADNIKPASFRLRLFTNHNTDVEPELDITGSTEDLADYMSISLPGFDTTVSVSFKDVWPAILNGNLKTYSGKVIGFETIVKFGNTMQLENIYTVMVEINDA